MLSRASRGAPFGYREPKYLAPSPSRTFLGQVAGREIYTFRPKGQGRSPLAAALGKLPLRGAVTTRNWNTVLKLLQMLDG